MQFVYDIVVLFLCFLSSFFLRVENATLNVGKKHNRYAQKVCSFRLKQSWIVKEI